MTDDARLEAEKLASLAEFAAAAGHEINNPLAVISGRAQLLLAGEPDPDRRRDLATIRQQALRIHEMISDLMHFARPAEPRFERVAVNVLVGSVTQSCAARGSAANVSIAWQPAEHELFVSGDATQLAVALSAILDNAIEATAAGSSSSNNGAADRGRIQVSAAIAADLGEFPAVGITVSDNGPGFDAAIRRHLFDPFFAGRTAGRGLGMGLAKCWGIVTRHGGRIDLSSQPGHGAAFTIVLPLDGVGEAGATRPKRRASRAATPKSTRRNKKSS